MKRSRRGSAAEVCEKTGNLLAFPGFEMAETFSKTRMPEGFRVNATRHDLDEISGSILQNMIDEEIKPLREQVKRLETELCAVRVILDDNDGFLGVVVCSYAQWDAPVLYTL